LVPASTPSKVVTRTQGQLSGDVLESRQIGAEIGALAEGDVEGVDIDERELQVLGRGEVGVRHQTVGILVLGDVIEVA